MKRKKILVTGGAGFIGSHVNKMLYKSGYETVVLDNLQTGTKEAVVQGELIEGDIGDNALLDQIFSQGSIDAVMHFAALINVGESVEKPDIYYENNVVKTLCLLNAMRRHGVMSFVFSSSAAVFGVPKTIPLDESHPANPINPYGKTKLMVEQILQDYDRAYGLRFAALRYFNAAGGDPEGIVKNKAVKQHNLIPMGLKSLLQGSPLTIFGTDYPTKDGTCVRDYIHIDDLGAAHILALKRIIATQKSGYYNLGNGQGYTVREVIESIERVTGLKLTVIEGVRRAGDPEALVADSRLAENELGWKRQFQSLDKIVADAWGALR